MQRLAIAILVVAASILAGCAGGPGNGPAAAEPGDVGDIDATATTGGIHGFVVDEKITPIKDATVTVLPSGALTQTDEGGAFVLSGLEPGTYFVKAEHPLYDSAQQSVEVVAGVA
ncbi:MAG: Carboxypeptidase regulatory-like domain, partial [Thermoplasmata archaeon]|nr:Carboxypeptidase regulatory-like domain [Thermoplasmata archaeon]